MHNYTTDLEVLTYLNTQFEKHSTALLQDAEFLQHLKSSNHTTTNSFETFLKVLSFELMSHPSHEHTEAVADLVAIVGSNGLLTARVYLALARMALYPVPFTMDALKESKQDLEVILFAMKASMQFFLKAVEYGNANPNTDFFLSIALSKFFEQFTEIADLYKVSSGNEAPDLDSRYIVIDVLSTLYNNSVMNIWIKRLREQLKSITTV